MEEEKQDDMKLPEPEPEKDEVKIKVFTTATCPWCIKAKNWLKDHKIKFKEINVEEDQDAANFMVEKTGQMGVPVIQVGEQFIVGFDEGKLRKVLNITE